MSPEVARADGHLVAQWALEGLEGGEHGTAFARSVHVLQHEPWHRFSIRQPAASRHRGNTLVAKSPRGSCLAGRLTYQELTHRASNWPSPSSAETASWSCSGSCSRRRARVTHASCSSRASPGSARRACCSSSFVRPSRRGCLALRGSAAEFERELPFGVVVDAFDEYLESLDPREFNRLSAEDLGELAGVFPALSSLNPGSDQPTTAAERFRAHRAVRDLIESLAVRQPLVVMLDDLHWADGASLELTSYLLRHPPRGAVMVAATLRSRAGRSRADGHHREGDEGCRGRPSDRPGPAHARRREDPDRQCRWRRTRAASTRPVGATRSTCSNSP